MMAYSFFYAPPADGVSSRAWSAARARRISPTIPAVVGCVPPKTRRAIRSISSSVVTALRRSSSVAASSLARGADPNQTFDLEPLPVGTLHVLVICALCNQREELEEREALDVLKLLIRSGAQVEARDSKGDTPLATALGNSSNHLTSVRLGLLAELLRAGANIDKCCLRGNVPVPFETLWQNRETCEQNDPSFVAAKAFMNEVRAAGSYRKWTRLPHKSVARLRSLVVRGRATTSDPALAFILKLGDNGLFWKCLEFWPGRAVVY